MCKSKLYVNKISKKLYRNYDFSLCKKINVQVSLIRIKLA